MRHNGPMTEHHHPLTPTQVLSFMRAQPWAVEASVTPQGAPQAAVVGIAITDRWELLFDTVTAVAQASKPGRESPRRVRDRLGTRADRAIRRHCELPTEAELPGVQAYYFDRFPDGPTRQSWPGLVYWRVRPHLDPLQQSHVNPPIIQEWDAAAIAGWLSIGSILRVLPITGEGSTMAANVVYRIHIAICSRRSPLLILRP